jgi:endoglucanase
LVLLTRAEEVGYIGCIAHLEDLARTLKNRRPRELVYVSLETSRQIPPEAVLGAGPVVRLGDRSSVFHSGYTHALQKLAQRVLPKEHQVRVMNGGTCEASAILAYGHPAIGVSIPLGNYHNQSIEGGPDAAPPQGPAPEFVDERDVARLLKLCEALSQPQPEFRDPWKAFRQELRKDLKSYRPLLRSI